MATAKIKRAMEALTAFALGLPGAYEDHPWGDTVAKAGKKIFVFLGADGMSVKLPESSAAALELPFVKPTAYGLGKSGWVSITFPPNEAPPLELLREWVEESYRALAPKTLVKQLDQPPVATPEKKSPKKRPKKTQAPTKRGNKG